MSASGLTQSGHAPAVYPIETWHKLYISRPRGQVADRGWSPREVKPCSPNLYVVTSRGGTNISRRLAKQRPVAQTSDPSRRGKKNENEKLNPDVRSVDLLFVRILSGACAAGSSGTTAGQADQQRKLATAAGSGSAP